MKKNNKKQNNNYPTIQNAPSEDSDQIARMRRLIWIFAGRTYPKVHLLTLWLILPNYIFFK